MVAAGMGAHFFTCKCFKTQDMLYMLSPTCFFHLAMIHAFLPDSFPHSELPHHIIFVLWMYHHHPAVCFQLLTVVNSAAT